MIRRGLSGLLLVISVTAAQASDGGGRDVSVALFSTRSLHSVTVAPVGRPAWMARCATCAHEQLTRPMHVSAPIEIFAGGTLRVTDDASGEERAASGLWHLRSSADQMIDVVLTMPSERYVAAVLRAESSASEPRASLEALAVLARTYALNGSHYVAAAGRLKADLCDSTQCQAMRLGPASQSIEDAAFATAGETLWFGDARAEVFFSQHCGGMTEDASAAWPGHAAVPYLRAQPDVYCVKRGNAAWHAEIALTKVEEIARGEGWRLPSAIISAEVTARSVSHRALRVTFRGTDGSLGVVSASALRFGIGRALGWDEVRSDAFEVAVRNGMLVFDGHGHGHGVGLCQTGATEMAAEGKSAREILGFYFPGTAVRILPGDDGWREVHAGVVAVRVVHALSTQEENNLESAWAEAQRTFPPRRTIAPKVVFAPSTEIFRQMTAQPGWALASTRDRTIVLQPESVLRANGRDGQATLLHEMLHVVVESECNESTPLWLREGLVEELADQRSGDAERVMSVNTIDQALRNAASLNEAARAHRMAGDRARGLIARYGLSTVRGWLSSGVPAGVD